VQDGAPISMLLDLVQVAKSHTGLTLAAVFAKILEDFGIADKVSKTQFLYFSATHMKSDLEYHLR
jgi:hypothetical protein